MAKPVSFHFNIPISHYPYEEFFDMKAISIDFECFGAKLRCEVYWPIVNLMLEHNRRTLYYAQGFLSWAQPTFVGLLLSIVANTNEL